MWGGTHDRTGLINNVVYVIYASYVISVICIHWITILAKYAPVIYHINIHQPNQGGAAASDLSEFVFGLLHARMD